MAAHQSEIAHFAVGPEVPGSRGPGVPGSGGPTVLVLAVTLLTLCGTVLLASGSSDLRTQGPRDPGTQGLTRIISLVPAVTEILYAVGAGPRVVGVSSFDRYPPEVRDKPRVGALVDPDFERILSLRPELVIVYGTQTDLIARLERARVAIYRYEHAGLADVTKTIRALGDRIGRGAEAARLADQIERDIAGIRQSVAGKPRPRTAVLFDREPGSLRGMFASGGIGFMHDMLEAAGGTDVFGDIARQSLQATTELLLARAPEVILEVHGGQPWPAAKIAAETRIWQGLPSIPAVRASRVHILVDDRLSIPGPRVADGIRVLAAVLHRQ